jgi:hypothetical protein
VSLVDFKEFIKWGTDASEDITMTSCLKTATMQAESFTRRVISVAPWQSTLPYFTSTFLDVLPVTTIVIKYDDVNGAEQTLSASEYTVMDNGPDDYVEIRFDGTMPTLESDNYEPVRITYSAGYSALPEGIKLGIMQLAASYFENRQNEVIGTSSNLIGHSSLHTLYPYKLL